MKKLIAFILCFVITVIFPINVMAHPGKLDNNNGHTCRTDCAAWGLEDDEYHFHNGDTYTNAKGQSFNKDGTLLKNNVTTKSSTTTTKNSKGIYEVVRVVDGDTIKIVYDGKEESVRLIGVDTPESVHADAKKNSYLGKCASEFTKERLTGKKVTLEFDVQARDKYNRLLAYVYLDGKMFNKTLLEEGYAQVATYPPNVKYVEDFKTLQTAARNNNKGLWNPDNCLEPDGTKTGEFNFPDNIEELISSILGAGVLGTMALVIYKSFKKKMPKK